MKFKRILVLLAIGLAVYSSCTKENVDVTDKGDGNVVPDTSIINCDTFAVNISGSYLDSTFYLTANHSTNHPPYTYAWSNGASTQTITSNTGGTYSVTVTDANGCTAVGTAEVNGPDPCQSFYVIAAMTPTGSAGVIPVNGQAPYLYAWSNGATTSEIMVTLGNTYTVTVTSADGCSATATVSAIVLCDSMPVFINLTPTGLMYAQAPLSNPPFTYAWSNGATTQSTQATATGWYYVTVTAADGCQGVGSTYYTSSDPCASLGVQIAQDSSNLNLVIAQPFGGTVPYAYNWSNGNTTQTISVSAGNTYTVTVIDAQGCTASDFIQL